MSLAVLLAVSAAWASSLSALRVRGAVYVEASETARALGMEASGTGPSLSLRGEAGILTVFEGSPDLLWRPRGGAEEELSLPLPVLREGGRWFLPAGALEPLGVRLEGGALAFADGRRFDLRFPPAGPAQAGRWEPLSLAGGVPALAFYAPGLGGAETVSLTLLDATLLAVAYPGARAAVDGVLAPLGKVLYLVAVATGETSWESEITFLQGGRSFTASSPQAISLLAGEAGRVGPDAPVSGLVFLPDWLELRRPVTVRWAETSATFQFRR